LISDVLVAVVFAAALAVWRAAVKRHLTKVDAPDFSFGAGGGALGYSGLFVPYGLGGWLPAAISSLAVAVLVWQIRWRRLRVNDVGVALHVVGAKPPGSLVDADGPLIGDANPGWTRTSTL